jgi:hypothetical protein
MLRLALRGFALALGAHASERQPYRPIRMIVESTAGTGTEIGATDQVQPPALDPGGACGAHQP